MDIDVENLQQQIPHYLSAEDRKVLVRELEAISRDGTATEFLLSDYNNQFTNKTLQGDGWEGFKLFLFPDGQQMDVRGLVLSNSCDVNLENKRDVPARVVFAPLVKLTTYENILRKSQIPNPNIDAKLVAIKAQKTTNIFYIPGGGILKEPYIIRLDDLYSMPVSAHADSMQSGKLFTLNNTGFYMLVFKLSVHFCRLHENVVRTDSTSSTEVEAT